MAAESRRLIVLALIANGLIAVVKFVAAGISGSSAMLAEGFHSVADTGNQLLLLRGSAVSRYSPTAQYPFGRGKELYFWGFSVAVFLFMAGAVVAFVEGLGRIRNPVEEQTGLVFSLIVLGAAGVFEAVVAFRPALKEFNRRRGGRSVIATVRDTRDSALLVVVFEDAAAIIGVAIAASGLLLSHYTGWSQWDGIASIALSILLTCVAWILAFEMKALLVGESATREERSLIRAATFSVPEVKSIGRLLTMQLSSSEILINMEVDLDDGLTGIEVEAAIDAIEKQIKDVVPHASHIFVELNSVGL